MRGTHVLVPTNVDLDGAASQRTIFLVRASAYFTQPMTMCLSMDMTVVNDYFNVS